MRRLVILIAAGAILVVLGLALSVWTSFVDTDTLSGALTVAVWDVLPMTLLAFSNDSTPPSTTIWRASRSS